MSESAAGAVRPDAAVVNGVTQALPRGARGARLSRWLRDDVGELGVKVGCEEGSCGSCTVLLDDEAVPSCLVLCGLATGCRVDTASTLVTEEPGRTLTESLLAAGALQCGYCTPGIVATMTALLRAGRPGEAEVRAALAAHLCRCTGYASIVRAVLAAAGSLDDRRTT